VQERERERECVCVCVCVCARVRRNVLFSCTGCKMYSLLIRKKKNFNIDR